MSRDELWLLALLMSKNQQAMHISKNTSACSVPLNFYLWLIMTAHFYKPDQQVGGLTNAASI